MLPAVTYTHLNQHYAPAVELARLILRSTSFTLAHGPVQASSFLLDMNKVFENFLVVALRDVLQLDARSFRQGAQGGIGSLRLDEGKRIELEPDLSWWEGNTCLFVGDAKYKRVNAAGVQHADLYQLLAYTVAGDLPGGLLVYAEGEAEQTIHRVNHAGKELEVATLDLQGSPEEILRRVGDIARQIRSLRQRGLALKAA